MVLSIKSTNYIIYDSQCLIAVFIWCNAIINLMSFTKKKINLMYYGPKTPTYWILIHYEAQLLKWPSYATSYSTQYFPFEMFLSLFFFLFNCIFNLYFVTLIKIILSSSFEFKLFGHPIIIFTEILISTIFIYSKIVILWLKISCPNCKFEREISILGPKNHLILRWKSSLLG